MFTIVRAILDRVKVLFISSAALELEAELAAQVAERRAELLRQAMRYEAEGLHGVAQYLRRQADELSVQRPLAGVLPTIAHLEAKAATPPLLRLVPDPDEDGADVPSPRPSRSLSVAKSTKRRKS